MSIPVNLIDIVIFFFDALFDVFYGNLEYFPIIFGVAFVIGFLGTPVILPFFSKPNKQSDAFL